MASTMGNAQTAPAVPLDQIVAQMQAAEKATHNRPEYTLLREYRIFGGSSNSATSQVLAEVSYTPPGSKQFAIRKTEGSERGEKIVRRVLEHEVSMTKDSSKSEFSPANYEFALLGQESFNGKPYYVLGLRARHETPELLNGKAWIDPDNFLVVRVEGQPAKNPSWWIKDLRIAIDYGRADGIWLPLATRATAELRLLGTHVLTSRDIEVRAATEDARVTRPAPAVSRRKRARNAAVDAGVWVAR